jgi:ribosomal 50S subunit-recycling heat shock protein
VVAEQRTVTHEVNEDEAGERLDKLLADAGLVASRAVAQRLIDDGCVTVDGMPVRKSRNVRDGDFIEVEFPEPSASDLVAEEILPGTVQDATSQLLDMKQKGADYGFTQVTINNTSAVLRDAKKLGMTNVKWGTNTWGFGENLVAVAKDAAEGVVAPAA